MLSRQTADPAGGGMNPHQQFVERRTPADWNHNFAIEDERARLKSRKGVFQVREIARQRLP